MIEQLFGSKTRVKLLQLFLANPGRSFYVREITRKIDEQINSVRRELSNLLGIGIIKSDSVNNKLYYEVNQGYKHFKALQSIFSVELPQQDISPASQKDLIKRLQTVGSFDVVVVAGHLVGSQRSDVDLLLVGSSNKPKLEKLMATVEIEEGSPIAYSVMSESELKYRIDIKDRFIVSLLSSKHAVLADASGMIKKYHENER
jgi:hypothetical protein